MTDAERPATPEDPGEPDGEDETRDPATGQRDSWPELPTTERAPVDGTVPQPRGSEPAGVPAGDGPATRPAADAAPESTAGGPEFPLWDRSVTSTATLPDPPVRRQVSGQRQDTSATAVPRRPRRPLIGLPLLLVLGLLAAFFGWVGAEPFWIAVGHADRGSLVIADCTGGGITKRCTGDFTAAGSHHPVRGVALSGATVADAHPGTRLAARMVGPSARTAYAGDRLGLLLRWAVPLALVVLIGLLTAAATGAWRLRGRHRFAAVVLSLAGPLVLAAGITAAAW